MLKNKFVKEKDTLKTHGFIIAVEMEEGTAVEPIALKLAGALTWVEGVGQIDVDYLGEITVMDEVGDVDANVIES